MGTSSLRLAERPANFLEVGSLDNNAAIAFLQAQGVVDTELAARIVGQVGGLPLSLKLAASLIKRDGADAKGVRNLAGRSSFWFSASDEMIQGQLFERILGHIHNPQVERLAHPGLVMRRITPDVILKVLNEPCSLDITSIEEAQSLFNELRNETALVVINQDEDAEELIHRPDLRRIMLKLLVQKSPAQVRDIHQRAITWYSSRPGLRARAEELYHRLQLGEAIAKSAFDDRSVRFSIQASIEELPIESQLLLASYGLDVSNEILERASREEREAGMAAKIEELLPYGPTSVGEAAIIASGLLKEAYAGGPAYRAAARVALQQGDVKQGLQLLEQGLSLTIPANDTMQTLGLLCEKAWAVRRTPEETAVLDQLNEYARRHQSKSAILQQRAQYHALAFSQDLSAADSTGKVSALREIAGLLADLNSIQIWELVPALGLVISELVVEYPDVPFLLRPKLIEEAGPFQSASFADRWAEETLSTLVNDAMSGEQSSTVDPDPTFAVHFERLCSAWPYRVLRVQPPYGRRGSRRFTSRAA
ncbi:hypothetical protein QIH91_35050 [Bradyrhizobium japonicum USDA 135]|nr:hypothetical protein QIH91_35050 [Bradyrhizobium japonicum USDA 135]